MRPWTAAAAGRSRSVVRSRPPSGSSATVTLECAGRQSAWAEIIGPGAGMSQEPHIAYHSYGGAWTSIFAEQYFPHPGSRVSAQSPGAYPGPFSAISGSSAAFIDHCPACNLGTAPIAIADDGGLALYRPGNVGAINFPTGASFITTSQGWVTGVLLHRTPKGTGAASYAVVLTIDGGRTWHTQYSIGP